MSILIDLRSEDDPMLATWKQLLDYAQTPQDTLALIPARTKIKKAITIHCLKHIPQLWPKTPTLEYQSTGEFTGFFWFSHPLETGLEYSYPMTFDEWNKLAATVATSRVFGHHSNKP